MTAILSSPARRDDSLLRIARLHAARIGILGDDAEDCAMEFVARMLQQRAATSLADTLQPWLHRCAHNHACNFRRALSRLHRHEAAWSGPAAEFPVCRVNPKSASPLQCTLRAELRRQIAQALMRLQPLPRALFVRHYAQEETVENLARALGKTPGAVRKILFRARRQMQARFARHGLTEADLRDYLEAS